MLDLNYDAKYDILNIGFFDRRNSIGDEEYDGLLIMRDEDTNIITGLTIFGFSLKYKSNKLPHLPHDIMINFENDVLPHICLQ